jgi:glucose-6-phosphate 1-epimerase
MPTTYFYDWQKKSDAPGRVTFKPGKGGLPKIEIETAYCSAEIYLQGAHVTRFQKTGEESLLFMSEASRFESGHPIRGGVPVIFPWFGPREGHDSHGFARNHPWEIWEITLIPNGGVRVQFRLPECAASATDPACLLNYAVTAGETLICELTVTNCSTDRGLVFENCLHTYLRVGDISRTSIAGLGGGQYLDKLENGAVKTQNVAVLTINQETDRIYCDSPNSVELIDESSRRKIRVEKSGGLSTVVWNPWVEKSKRLADFGDDEYHKMVCIESGNVAENRISLPPGQSSALKLKLISNAL